MNSLRERCKNFYQSATRKAIMRTGDPVDDLTNFVMSEIGRAGARDKLENTKPLVLYFSTDKDREDFLGLWNEAMPGAIARSWP